MTNSEKIADIKVMLGLNDTWNDKLNTYLRVAKNEILMWAYQGNVPTTVSDVPAEYESIQIQAVITGLSHEGSNGQTVHNENGINRTFKFTDMIDYIHKTITPYARIS